MEELSLVDLEQQIDTLIAAFELKIEENANLAKELARLKQQQSAAQEKIQTMIHRLKLIETEA